MMYANLVTLFIILVYSCSLTTSVRVNVITYKTENSNNCDITLDLSNAGLRYLGVNFINTNCVRNLILQNNSIENLQEEIFDNQPHLEYLDLSRNHLKLNDIFSHGGQSSLKVFILDHNTFLSHNVTETIEVDENSDTDHGNSDGVESIQNSHTELKIQSVFSELKYLSLRNVQINALSNYWFNYFPKLNHLDLSENRLTEKTLKFLLQNISATVTNLILEKVGIKIVRTEHLNNIEQLNLNHNRLPRLSSRKCYDNTLCLENMENLKTLSICNCSVKYIEENAFKYMKNLRELDISNNCFWQIPNKTFNYLPNLTSLDLSQNSLYSMPNIEYLQNLTSLILDNMKIKKMLRSLETFPYLPNLKHLSMQSNKLGTIPPTLFNSLPKLEKLDLSNNHIMSLPSWDTQKSLRQLYLGSNQIENLDNLSIKEARSLEILVLKNNSISKIKLASLKNLPSGDVVLDL